MTQAKQGGEVRRREQMAIGMPAGGKNGGKWRENRKTEEQKRLAESNSGSGED